MPRRFGSRQADNETLVSTHPHPSEGSPELGIPARRDPLPGEHEYHVSDPVTREQLAVPPAKPYYSGGVAHGVVSPVKHGGRPTPHHDERDTYRTEDESFPPEGKWKAEPIPVFITEGGAGTKSLTKASFRQVGIRVGADPIPLVERNDTREQVFLLNETATGGVRLKNGPDTAPGTLLPAAMSSYLRLPTQDQIWAIADPSANVEQLVSVIEVYRISR